MSFLTRPEQIARFIVDKSSTIRAAAKHFGLSKSTVHVDVSKRLKHINKSLYVLVREILQINFCQKNIRGGEATRLKYQNKAKVV